MSDIRKELDTRVSRVVNLFAKKNVDQEFITGLWAAVHDEIQNFNDETMKFSQPAMEYIHSYYLNIAIKIKTKAHGTVTIGQLATQETPPTLADVPLVELYRIKSVFSDTPLERRAVTEIQKRLEDDGNTEQAARSNKQLSN